MNILVTHNIINLSDTENLVTVMTCNENFHPNHPDTFFEPVEKKILVVNRRMIWNTILHGKTTVAPRS